HGDVPRRTVARDRTERHSPASPRGNPDPISDQGLAALEPTVPLDFKSHEAYIGLGGLPGACGDHFPGALRFSRELFLGLALASSTRRPPTQVGSRDRTLPRPWRLAAVTTNEVARQAELNSGELAELKRRARAAAQKERSDAHRT